MFRRLLACALAGSALLLVVPSTAAGAVNSTSLPSSARACLGGGWRSLSDAQGRPFKNQGECVAFMLRHPVTLADLSGSYVGGTGNAVQNGGTCPPVGFDFYLKFDTTYTGSAAVGTVALHLEGCAEFSIDFTAGTFTAGTFSLSTNVGSVSGTTEGSVTATLDRNSNVTVDLSLTFTVTSGTGAFSTTTGTLRFTQHAPPFASVTGTITA
jgi:hypothetical protein